MPTPILGFPNILRIFLILFPSSLTRTLTPWRQKNIVHLVRSAVPSKMKWPKHCPHSSCPLTALSWWGRHNQSHAGEEARRSVGNSWSPRWARRETSPQRRQLPGGSHTSGTLSPAWTTHLTHTKSSRSPNSPLRHALFLTLYFT